MPVVDIIVHGVAVGIAQILRVNQGSGGLVTGINIVAARAFITVLPAVILIIGRGCTLIQHIALRRSGAPSLRHNELCYGRAGIDIKGGVQGKVISPGALVQVNHTVTLSRQSPLNPLTNLIICDIITVGGHGKRIRSVTVTNHKCADGVIGISGVPDAQMDVLTIFSIARVEVAPHRRPAVIAQPILCVTVAGTGIVQHTGIDILCAIWRIVFIVVFRERGKGEHCSDHHYGQQGCQQR